MVVATLSHTASLFVGVVSLFAPATVVHPSVEIRGAMAAQVRVYDNVGLRPDDRNRALAAAAQLLGTVSVRITWRQCPAEGPEFCQSELAGGERVVRILNSPGTPMSWEGKPLGGAVIDVEAASSVLATAYVNRVESNAGRCGVDTYLLLGRVVAHELRHVLSAEPGHSPAGIMREQWTCDELRANRREDWSFLTADRSAIFRGVSRETR